MINSNGHYKALQILPLRVAGGHRVVGTLGELMNDPNVPPGLDGRRLQRAPEHFSRHGL